MTNDDTHDTPDEPKGRPIPASYQARRSAMETTHQFGLVSELLPSHDDRPPVGDAAKLLRLLDDVMLGTFRATSEPEARPVAWTALPRAGEQTRIRSAAFRAFLAATFYRDTGKVLKDARAEEVVLLLCGAVTVAMTEQGAR